MSSTSNKISNDTFLAPFVLASFVMLSDGLHHRPWVPCGAKPGLALACVRHCCEVRFFSCDLAVQADVAMGGYRHSPWSKEDDGAAPRRGTRLAVVRGFHIDEETKPEASTVLQ
jgi:hypothetical protein